MCYEEDIKKKEGKAKTMINTVESFRLDSVYKMNEKQCQLRSLK